MHKQLARFVLVGSSFMALALAGCSGGAEVGQGPQALGTGATAEEVQADVGHGRYEPATFVQRFDKNGDGALDATELGPKRWDHLKVADADGNGSVTSAEIQAARQSGALPAFQHGKHERGKWLTKLDKNGDGAIDATEAGERWEHLKAADADGNGSVTPAEIQAARDNGLLRAGHGEHERGKWLAKLDKNGDGVIDASEAPERMRAKLDAADADHDGKVTVEELRASFAAHRGERRLVRLDKNGDGVVTQDECDARVWERVGRADANADGRVTKEELEAARAPRIRAPR